MKKYSYFCRRMKKPFEKRTSWKIVVVNLFLIAFCGAMLYFVYDLRDNIHDQRVNIDQQRQALDMSSRFTQLIHEAQSEANLYAFTDNPRRLSNFGKLTNEIQCCADTLLSLLPNHDNDAKIAEILQLIQRKGQISYVLSSQFSGYNPMAEIDAVLDAYQPRQIDATTVTTKTQHDTIIRTNPRKNIWQRLGEVFNPSEPDSIVQVSTQTIDTALTVTHDSLDIVDDLKILTDKAREEYRKQVKDYEAKTAELIADDNKLSEQLSKLLLSLNDDILNASVAEIAKSDEIVQENIKTSTLIASIVLILIIIFVILIISDVNKGYRATKAAEEAKKKTEETMESRHKMLLSVSHDIKTPLTSIMGNLELMDTQHNANEAQAIHQSANHILDLLHDLLDFSSLEQGKLTAENQPFNILSLCDETATMFESIARQKKLIFNYQHDLDSHLVICSDRLKIKQILSNLISNAIKYTLEGQVDLVVSHTQEQIQFSVHDTGIGIAPEKVDDVFKPFIRIDTKTEGNGYGLSVVKGLVELLGGDISVKSTLGEGSTFTVTLPAQWQAEQQVTEEENMGPNPSEQMSNSRPVIGPTSEMKTILVIDDDSTLLTVISNMISKIGHQVMICQSKDDLNEALEQADSIDAILTDREMGAVSGNDILKIFKEKSSSMPVYLMTARTEYNEEKAQQEGFDGFLRKPFRIDDLKELFGCPVDRSDAGKEAESCPFQEDFPMLCSMMDNDTEAIQGILTVFVQSTANDLVSMNDLLEEDNFSGMQALCHKMLPMFKQLEYNNCILFLSKMNEMRGKSKTMEDYPEWKEASLEFMSEADKILETLSEKYGIE